MLCKKNWFESAVKYLILFFFFLKKKILNSNYQKLKFSPLNCGRNNPNKVNNKSNIDQKIQDQDFPSWTNSDLIYFLCILV